MNLRKTIEHFQRINFPKQAKIVPVNGDVKIARDEWYK